MKVISSIAGYVLEACRNKRVMYVGAGDEHGGLSVMARRVYQISQHFIGIDGDPAVIAGNPDVPLIVWDLNKPAPAMKADEIDVVVMTEVLEHLMAPAVTLRELSKLAPGALFVGSVPNGLSFGRVCMALIMPGLYAQQDGNHTMLFNRNTLANTLRQAGLSDFQLIPYEERKLIQWVACLKPDFACGYIIKAKLP